MEPCRVSTAAVLVFICASAAPFLCQCLHTSVPKYANIVILCRCVSHVPAPIVISIDKEGYQMFILNLAFSTQTRIVPPSGPKYPSPTVASRDVRFISVRLFSPEQQRCVYFYLLRCPETTTLFTRLFFDLRTPLKTTWQEQRRRRKNCRAN